MSRNSTSSEARRQTLAGAMLSEPRIPMIARRLQALLAVVQLEADGQPVEIDGFRLRDPAHWTVPAAPVHSELWHASNRCNLRCPFCYESGDPEEGSVLGDNLGMATMAELEARLGLRRGGRAPFRPLTKVREIFCNPHILDMIERLREAVPHEVLTFVTNGTLLDEDRIRRLARLKPLFFNVSVNSLDPRIRREVLGDPDPGRVLRALELLREHDLPYLASLVCWPSIPWDDIARTVHRLDELGCAVVRFSLSAYSRWAADLPFDRRTFWEEGARLARRLQDEVEVPIKVEPYHFVDPSFAPHIVGAIRGSPAARAGLRPWDLLIAVRGHEVPSSNHALTALNRAYQDRASVEVTVQAPSGSRRAVLLDSNGPHTWPFSAMAELPGTIFGLVITDGLRFSYLRELRRIADERAARTVLLCSSELMKPVVERMIEHTGAFDDLDLYVEVPPNHFFGGTVALGDLLVVDDYVRFIERWCADRGGPPDLVVVPSSPFSLGGWMRDLCGVPASDIERRTGVPVVVLPCQPITG